MSFLNATLVLGTLAAVVPIVLHLIARREPRRVVFPSIGFLTKRFETNRSRLKVRRWWLLALRIAAVAALALALARPAIVGSLSLTWLTIGLVAFAGVALLAMASVALSKGQSRRVTTGLIAGAAVALVSALGWATYTYASGPRPGGEAAGPVAIAIVLDNSPTSAWRTENDVRIERMRDSAAWIVTQLPRTSRVAVLDRSSGPPSFSLDAAGALSKIERTEANQQPQSLASRIDGAARLLRTSDLPNRQIVVLTDLSESSWNESIVDAGLNQTLANDPAIAVTVWDLGRLEGMNRSLSIPEVADETPPRQTPVKLSAIVQVDSLEKEGGEQPNAPESVGVTAELQMYTLDPSLPVIRDDAVEYPALRSVDRASVTVQPGSSGELLLTIPALAVGVHHGQVRLIGDDAMPLDDVRYLTVEVLPPSSVLVVGDQADEVRILAQTIAAPTSMTDDGGGEFLVEQIGYADLPAARLADYAAVVLLDPNLDALGTGESGQVQRYLRSGGGVLMALGRAAGNEPIAPAEMPKLIRRWRVPSPGTFFRVTDATDPMTQVVAQDTPWSDFPVFQYWQVEPTQADRVLVRYADQGHPAVLVRTVEGEPDGPPSAPQQPSAPNQSESSPGDAKKSGTLMVLTTPIPSLIGPTQGWNDLFGTDPWPIWLLVRQSIEVLARRGSDQTMGLVGQPRSIELAGDAWPEIAQTRPATDRMQIFAPAGEPPVPVQVPAGAAAVTVVDVPTAGIYWLRGNRVGLGFSANLPAQATLPTRAERSRLDATFGPDGYSLISARTEIELAGRSGPGRVSLHSPAMLLALIVFLLEQVLGNRFYRQTA